LSSSSPIPPPFCHLRPLFSLVSSLPCPSYSTPCTLYSLPYSEFPFCSLSAVRTPTKLHPLPLLLVLLLRITGIYRQRAASAKSNPTYLLILRDLISARSCSFFPSYSPISLFSLQRSPSCRAVVHFFQPSNDCGKCRCFGPADASITARHCTLRSSIFEISM